MGLQVYQAQERRDTLLIPHVFSKHEKFLP
jgi:hypothetical protein